MPSVLVAAKRSGVDAVYKVGGAQAVGAMAYGTESVPRVCKIFGPGNTWVTSAKSLVATDPAGAAIDMPAGPSEVLVIADEDANAQFVASDLLSQAEHGEDSQVVLVSTSERLVEDVCAALDAQLAGLSRRAIAERSLQHARFIVANDMREAVAISNTYAPEHLILQVRDARSHLPDIRNAGSVFLGSLVPRGDWRLLQRHESRAADVRQRPRLLGARPDEFHAHYDRARTLARRAAAARSDGTSLLQNWRG